MRAPVIFLLIGIPILVMSEGVQAATMTTSANVGRVTAQYMNAQFVIAEPQPHSGLTPIPAMTRVQLGTNIFIDSRLLQAPPPVVAVTPPAPTPLSPSLRCETPLRKKMQSTPTSTRSSKRAARPNKKAHRAKAISCLPDSPLSSVAEITK